MKNDFALVNPFESRNWNDDGCVYRLFTGKNCTYFMCHYSQLDISLYR